MCFFKKKKIVYTQYKIPQKLCCGKSSKNTDVNAKKGNLLFTSDRRRG